MATRIEREQVRQLVEVGAQLVEVLPAEEYEEAHLPGAISIPLGELTPATVRRLDPSRPVITYCYDTQCDMSPRAARRLETLGFGEVYHYAPGKADWLGAGLPIEGKAADWPVAGDVARRDAPTCGLRTTVGEVRRRLADSEWDSCFVVDEGGIVLGRLYESELGDDDDRAAEDQMDPGPSTYRPDVTAVELGQHMAKADLATAPVTTSDGQLVGLAMRPDVERAAERTPAGRLTDQQQASGEG